MNQKLRQPQLFEKGYKIHKLILMETPFVSAFPSGKVYWKAKFECECGYSGIFNWYSVKCGQTTSCKKCAIEYRREIKTTHKLTKHSLYRKWSDMKKRCYNPNVERYNAYGARGIKVCDEWRYSFKKYFDWCINAGWNKKLQVDRIDVNGNYEPSNCRMIKPQEQHYNKQNTFYVSINKKNVCLISFLKSINLQRKYGTIHHGIKYDGRSMEYYIQKLGISTKVSQPV